MHLQVAIIYNQPGISRYTSIGEGKAVAGVLDEVDEVHRVLKGGGYLVSLVPLAPPLVGVTERLRALDVDIVFNLFEGFPECPGSEGIVARMLSDMGLIFTGCNSRALSLCLDKVRTKAVLDSAGIETPAYQVLDHGNLSSFSLDFPCIVKPCAEDASHGISPQSVVRDYRGLVGQVERVAEHYGGRALVEEFIDGREYNITVMGTDRPVVFPVSEIVFSRRDGAPGILTYDAKWESTSADFNGSKVVCPADIDVHVLERIKRIALSAFKATGCTGYARVDFRMDNQGRLMVIDVNPNPDIAHDSGAAIQARHAGLTYIQFIEKIITLAFQQNERQPIYQGNYERV
jgi:D-alanine-D-alanine ligase